MGGRSGGVAKGGWNFKIARSLPPGSVMSANMMKRRDDPEAKVVQGGSMLFCEITTGGGNWTPTCSLEPGGGGFWIKFNLLSKSMMGLRFLEMSL